MYLQNFPNVQHSVPCLPFCAKSHGPMQLQPQIKTEANAAETKEKDKLLTANALSIRDEPVHTHSFQHQLCGNLIMKLVIAVETGSIPDLHLFQDR